MLKTISEIGGKMFGGGGSEEKQKVIERAVKVNALQEYQESSGIIADLKQEMDKAPSFQKKQFEDEIHRHECRLDALRSAAVILSSNLETDDSRSVYSDFEISEKDEARVSSGITNPHQCPAHELVRFLIEQAQSDFIRGVA